MNTKITAFSIRPLLNFLAIATACSFLAGPSARAQDGDTTLTDIFSFNLDGGNSGTPNADGRRPVAGLLRASDGNFYGTTSGGGSNTLLELHRPDGRRGRQCRK